MTMEPFAKTAALVQQGLEQGAYPSACLSVGIGPRVLCRRTFGHVTGHTLYDMASVSKILGATMIALRWLEEGKLRLYDRVGAFLDAPADKADITILQLMTHTSGIPDHFLPRRLRRPFCAIRWFSGPVACPFTAAWGTSSWARSWSASAASPWTVWRRAGFLILWT